MRLLVDAREFVAGRRTGIGRFLAGLLAAVRALRPQWRVCCAMTKRCAVPAELEGSVEVVYPPAPFDLTVAAIARGFDVFLSPYPKLPPWLPIPAVHTIHDVLYLSHPAYRGRWLRRWGGMARLRWALNGAAISWFDSAASLAEARRLGLNPPRARVRMLAIDARFTPGEAVRPGGRFLFVGNGLPHKNVPVLLAALRMDPGLRLDLAGLRPEVAAQLRARFADLLPRLRLLHPGDEDLVRLYREAQALVLPSTAEGFGLPPLEAMACGTPAVVSDIPVLRETTGGAALRCPPNDARAWRDAMRRLLDPAEREAWRRRGLDWTRSMRAPEGWRAHLDDLAEVAR